MIVTSSTESLLTAPSAVTVSGPRAAAPARRLRPQSDRALISHALAGSAADVELLFRRHWPRAYRAAYLIVHDHAAAEDIAQEAFLAAMRHLREFDRRRRFGPWLGAIVANRAIDWVRARQARRESDREPPELTADVDSPSGSYSEEVVAALAACIPPRRGRPAQTIACALAAPLAGGGAGRGAGPVTGGSDRRTAAGASVRRCARRSCALVAPDVREAAALRRTRRLDGCSRRIDRPPRPLRAGELVASRVVRRRRARRQAGGDRPARPGAVDPRSRSERSTLVFAERVPAGLPVGRRASRGRR